MVFPLSGHDLGVGTRDVDTSVQAGLVVSIYDVTAKDLAGTVTAVVRSLGSRETVLGPAVRPAVEVENGVLLLQAEPQLVLGVLLHHEVCIVTEVVGVGLAIRHVGLADDEDVVTQTEGVGVEGSGAEVDVRVVTGSLTGGGTVEIPFWEFRNVGGLLWEGLVREDVSVGE